MNTTEAIQQTLREYPHLFYTGDRVADLEDEGSEPSSELVTLGSVIYSYLDNEYEDKDKLFCDAMSAASYHSAELNIEGNHELLIRAVWEQIAWCLEDEINICLHELEDDDATRQGL